MAEAHTTAAATDPVEQNLHEAAKGEGMPLPAEEGTHALTTGDGAGGAVGHHPDPSIGGLLDATVIVSIAMAVFIAILLWKKVPALIVGGLDKQIAAIRARLEEAKTLRAEAEALRDEYARKIADIDAQAQAMVAHAEDEAKALLAKAKADAAELTKRRAKMADDKIAAAERAAIQQIRATAADAATRAAAAILAEKHGAAADKPLVDKTIAGLSRLN